MARVISEAGLVQPLVRACVLQAWLFMCKALARCLRLPQGQLCFHELDGIQRLLEALPRREAWQDVRDAVPAHIIRRGFAIQTRP